MYYKEIILIFLFLFGSADAAKSPTWAKVGKWSVRVDRDETLVRSSLSSKQIAKIENTKTKKMYLFLYEDYLPVSIQSARAQMNANKGIESSLKVHKSKKSTVFSFFTKNGFVHWYSTKGGHLILTDKNISPTSYSIAMEMVRWNN